MATSTMSDVRRGEVWLGDMDPTRGHEQAGRRPVLVVSDDSYNRGPAGLVVIVPLTSTPRGTPLHVVIEPPDGGVRNTSTILCDNVRAISPERLLRRWGRFSETTMALVEERLRRRLSL